MRVGSRSTASKPALPSLARYSPSSSAPATHPIQSSTLRRICGGTSPRTTTSDTAKRPERFGEHPVLVGGQIDDAIRDDDVHRAVRERNRFDLALEELDVVDTG